MPGCLCDRKTYCLSIRANPTALACCFQELQKISREARKRALYSYHAKTNLEVISSSIGG
jgi:hypothetical protein